MNDTLHAGAGRRTINPPLGIGKVGGRLSGEPIQWIVSDLTTTALVRRGAGIRARSPLPDTFVLGYAERSMAYLPRAEDHPEGGWKLGERFALPDQILQFYPATSWPCTPTRSSARSRARSH